MICSCTVVQYPLNLRFLNIFCKPNRTAVYTRVLVVRVKIFVLDLVVRARDNGQQTHLSYHGTSPISISGYNAYLSSVTPFYAPESAHKGWRLAHGELAPLQECAKVAHDGHKHQEKPHSLAPIIKQKLNGFTRKTRTGVKRYH